MTDEEPVPVERQDIDEAYPENPGHDHDRDGLLLCKDPFCRMLVSAMIL